MKTTNVFRSAASAMLPCTLLVACGAGDGGVTPRPSTLKAGTSSLQLDDHPDPALSVTLTNGNVLEFYDLSSGVLVSEAGSATNPPLTSVPSMRALIESNDLITLFNTVRPELPIPAVLIRLQDKLAAAALASQSVPGELSTESQSLPSTGSGAATGTPSVAASAPGKGFGGGADAGGTSSSHSGGGRSSGLQPFDEQGCSNGCCDPTWLQANICQPINGADYSWYLFNYGWSFENSTSIHFWTGYACAAVGTSTYTVSDSDGGGGTWSVGEGTYRWFHHDTICEFLQCAFNITGSVNSSSDPHLHTFCGFVHN